MSKISLIGGGNIGSTLAYILSLKNIVRDVAIFDVNESLVLGKALDISQSLAIMGSDTKVIASSDINIIRDSQILVVTAGVTRKADMSRDDLLKTNLEIIKSIAIDIKKYSPNALVIVVTNPIDLMVYAMHRFTEFPQNQILGMAGVLDVARYKYFLAQEFKVSVTAVDALILGGHGDFMIPLKKYTTISAVPVLDMIKLGYSSFDRLNQIIERTKYGGGEIVSLLGSGSAYYSPALAVLEMIESYLFDKKKILPCSVLLTGEYGLKDLFIGVPIILGRGGVESIISLTLDYKEQQEFDLSARKIRSLLKFIS